MLKKIKNIFYLASFLIFIILITRFYFSDQNIKDTNKSRSSYVALLDKDVNSLPLLKNDTNNAIVYINDLENFKSKRKKRLWEKLISNNNE